MTTAQSEPKAPAHPDPGFAKNGELIINMPGDLTGTGASVATDDKNNIVYVANSNEQFVIGRIKSNGEIDSTFANQGQLKDTFANGIDSIAFGVSVQSDTGRILLHGAHVNTQGIHPAFAMFDFSGNYVSEFGNDGKIVIPLPSGAQPSLQANNSLGGTASTTCQTVMNADGTILYLYGGYVIRLNSDGSLDESFNHGKGYINAKHPEYDFMTTSLLQTDSGDILVGGVGGVSSQPFSMVGRYLGTGELDTSFAKNGYFLLTSWDYRNGIFKLVAADRNSVIGIGTSMSAPEKGLLFRLNEYGNLDATFNKGEPKTTPDTPTPGFSWVTGTVDNKGGVLVISDSMTSSGDGDDIAIAIAKFSSTGDPDMSFAPRNGWFRVQASRTEDVTVDSLGRIVVMASTALNEGLQRPKVIVIRA
jgi:uncharacterized delta-60 repeat protein